MDLYFREKGHFPHARGTVARYITDFTCETRHRHGIKPCSFA
jgi:hypothetical protein